MFPGGLVVSTQGFHCCGLGSIPGLGTEIPHQVTAFHDQKKRKERKKIGHEMKNPPLAQPQLIDFLNLGSSKFACFKVFNFEKKRYYDTSLIHQMWYFGLVHFPDNLLPLFRPRSVSFVIIFVE